MRVAITYHYSVAFGGSERVLEVLAGMFPEADFFCLFVDDRYIPPALKDRRITTSFLDGIPGVRRFYRHLLPLYPLAAESLNLSGYDLVLSADGAATKGVLTDQHALHLCYCHSPQRSFWDQYFPNRKRMGYFSRAAFAPISQYMRLWDFAAAQRIDGFIANSAYVAERIRKYYRRESTIIPPPVNTRWVCEAHEPADYYLSVGRLVPAKRTDLLVRACNELGRPLKIAGSGPELAFLRQIAGPKTEFVGSCSDEELVNLYSRCRALLFAADEDFGIVPLEAQAFGRPVVAYGHGGSLETIIGLDSGEGDRPPKPSNPSPTGIFFRQQTVESLKQAILFFERNEDLFVAEEIKRHARRFETEAFVQKLSQYIEKMWSGFQRSTDS